MQGSTIVFDLDGTLIDTAPDLVRAANHCLAQRGLPAVSPHIIKSYVGYGARRTLEAALMANDVELTDPEIDHLLDIYLDFYANNIAVESRPFPHVLEQIEALRSAGTLIAICTNKREDMSLRLIRALDLDHHFAAIAGRDTFAVHKPDPRHLTSTIEKAGGDVNRAIMIGDTNTDIKTARAANIPVIGVTFGYSPDPITDFSPDAAIDDYANLRDVIASLLSNKG